MENQPNRVVNPLVVTESMVTTLMSNDPNTCEDAALENPIDRPSNVGKGVWEKVKIRCRYVVEEKG